MIKNILLASCLLSIGAIASENETINTDGSEYKAPRLAGDSLAIKSLDKDSKSNSNSLTDMFSNGKIKGLIRYSAQHRDTSYHSTQSGISPQSNDKQQYSAIGGYLGYETATWNNISLGATFYTAHKAGNNPDDRTGLGGLNEDDSTANSYAVLGEAYIKYQDDENDFRFGRREMPNYRFISLSNIRFSPFTHEGTTYENTMIKDTKIILGYITKQKDRNAEHFTDMVRAARVTKSKTVGVINNNNFIGDGIYTGENKSMSMLGLTLNKKDFTLEAWDYYVDDFINTIYLYGDYKINLNTDTSLSFAAQYSSQKDIGNSVAGDVNTWFYGLKAQLALDSGITLFTAWNEVKYDESSYDGGTIFVRWGTPQMFNSFQVQDSETAGTKSIGFGAQFELGKMGIVPNTVIRFRYADYNMPDKLSQKFAAQDRTEATFDLRYSFTKNDGFGIFTEMKGLSVQFRVAYDNFKTNYNYIAYQDRHGVTFENVRDDFVDTRLYVDYMF